MQNPCTLIQFSDCHLFADVERSGYAQCNPYHSLAAVLADIARQPADAIVLTGDVLGEHDTTGYQHLSQLWQQADIGLPLHAIPGNHDEPDALMATSSVQSMVDQGIPIGSHWMLHGLSSHYRGTLGQVTPDALDRLSARIAGHPERHHAVAVHHHPVAVNGWMDRHAWVNREAFATWLAAHPQVKFVLHGHTHMATEQTLASTAILGCPSTCWQWANGAEFAVSDERPGYRMIHLGSDGQWTTTVKRVVMV
ncbi:metallophosphoesterase [Aestuariibacter halophilus]|uniref:Metallophosphoesterase n=1 Tax=Fluctibacter halophilus TaxID=226011 RepID=A0ABS8GBR5_9ALTE|nr:metallophosphoesterase [Aestuariibacter halophilus]MCC2617933.1 metallophosphoesterase [Aestuariibacter halophilus]